MNQTPGAVNAVRPDRAQSWNHGTHRDFYDYYAKESESEATLQRFRGIQSAVLRVAAKTGLSGQLDVADIGCGAGTQARLWAQHGHRVFGLDINAPLISLARERAESERLPITFEVGSATNLPWSDESMDVCLIPEVLEHVPDWQSCLAEGARVLKNGGLLYLSTTNVLCPRQAEFVLPFYSWYPRALKRYFEHLAVTTRPSLAGYATYPAVNWFSFYFLRDFLSPLGFHCRDRFDLIDPAKRGTAARWISVAIRSSRALRFIGHVATPSTYLVAIKSGNGSASRSQESTD